MFSLVCAMLTTPDIPLCLAVTGAVTGVIALARVDRLSRTSTAKPKTVALDDLGWPVERPTMDVDDSLDGTEETW